MNAIFTSEKLEKSYEIVNAVKNMSINEDVYQLNPTAASDTKVDLTRDPDTVTHTRNVILDHTLLICRTIREVYFLPLLTKPSKYTIIMIPQTLLTPPAKEIFADTTLHNAWANRTLWKIIRNGVDGSNTISTPIYSGIGEAYTPASSDINVTRIFIGTSRTSNNPPDEAI